MEVELGQLAERNGSAAAVKEFGARMVKDHTRLNNELGSVATSIGLTVPTDLWANQQPGLRDTIEIDRQKLRQGVYLMVKDNAKICAFQKAEIELLARSRS